jgi:hypothetical protein
MTIVRTDYRPKRARKRKRPVEIPNRIVSAKGPRPAAPAIKEAVTESKRSAAQPAAITGPRIVTARTPRARRLPDVPEMTAEEHQRRGDAAVELFKELVRRATWDGR